MRMKVCGEIPRDMNVTFIYLSIIVLLSASHRCIISEYPLHLDAFPAQNVSLIQYNLPPVITDVSAEIQSVKQWAIDINKLNIYFH